MEQKNKQSQVDDIALVAAEKKTERDKLVKICKWVIGAIVATVVAIIVLTLTGVL
jgi:hypothetical protein